MSARQKENSRGKDAEEEGRGGRQTISGGGDGGDCGRKLHNHMSPTRTLTNSSVMIY